MRNEISANIVLNAMIEGVFKSASGFALDGYYVAELIHYVDQDSTQMLAPEEILLNLSKRNGQSLLDFGCGTGGARTMIEEMGYKWRGVNYLGGMANSVRDAASSDSAIDFYDGLSLPYSNEEFDIVYSFQVFEHIQDIGKTFSEIARVLKPGGQLIGSVSYLEQIHDYSTYNFTPYGLKIACERSGLNLSKIYPSYDVFTWMMRRLLVVTSGDDDNSLTPQLSRGNAIDTMFADYSTKMGLDARFANLFRLMFSAHITFVIVKPGTAEAPPAAEPSVQFVAAPKPARRWWPR